MESLVNIILSEFIMFSMYEYKDFFVIERSLYKVFECLSFSLIPFVNDIVRLRYLKNEGLQPFT